MTLARDMTEQMELFLDGPKRGQRPREEKKSLQQVFLDSLKEAREEPENLLGWEALKKTIMGATKTKDLDIADPGLYLKAQLRKQGWKI